MNLIEEAAKALKNAHAKYSGFPVGCAVLTESGKVYIGCNVENACINAGFCAEPIAIGQAIASGDKKIKQIAVINGTDIPCPPCGGCLQFISEFVDRETEIISANKSMSRIEKFKFKDLLPVTYGGFYQK